MLTHLRIDPNQEAPERVLAKQMEDMIVTHTDDILFSHIRHLTSELESWRSIELQIHSTFVNKAKQKDLEYSGYERSSHYVETALGQRFFEDRIIPDRSDRTTLSIDYCNGEQCASRFRREKGGTFVSDQVSIKRSFAGEAGGVTDRPQPLQTFYVGLVPLPKALPNAVPLGTGRRIGHDCDLFLFPKDGANSLRWEYVYWLDRETSVPLRVETYRDAKARADHRALDEWNAKSLGEVQGHHLVLGYESLGYLEEAPNTGVLHFRIDSVVEKVEYDRDYPKSMFWPVITPETRVLDYVHNKVTPAAVHRGPSPATSSAQPIRAVDSGSLAPGLSTILVFLGLISLLIGALLWWRRRSSIAWSTARSS